jgi:hypothetical protein
MICSTTKRWRFCVALMLLMPVGHFYGQTLRCSALAAAAKSIETCPAFGCAVDGTPEAAANRLRNRPPATILGAVHHLRTVEAFEHLQKCVRLQQGLPIGDRKPFQKGFCEESRNIGEGVLVDIYGFIVGTPRIRRRDPASCLLIGLHNNSFRINIAQLADDPEFDSILVEMTPIGRDNRLWSLEKLRSLRGSRVHVTGQLFYDNKHFVNADPDDVIAGEPKRMSLWEIHPVTDFEVCQEQDQTACLDKPGPQWTKLERVP